MSAESNNPKLIRRFLEGTGGTLFLAAVCIPLTRLPVTRETAALAIVLVLFLCGVLGRIVLRSARKKGARENLAAIRSVSNWAFAFATVMLAATIYVHFV